jgi:hypothetical protein
MVRLLAVQERHPQHEIDSAFEKEGSQMMIGHLKKTLTTNFISVVALPRPADSINSHSGDAV